MRTTATMMALAALSIGDVLAGPTHVHLHREAHEKKDLEKKDYDTSHVDWSSIDWDQVGVDWKKVNYNGGGSSSASAPAATVQQAVAAVSSAASTSAAATSTAAAASSSSSSSSSSAPARGKNQFTGLFENLWNNLEGCANNNKAFGGQSASSGDYVSYISNVGIPYGSNMMFVDDASKYPYTMTFINTANKEMTINCWNKPGMDGQANSGATDAPKRTTITFNLSVGQSAIVAVDENTVLSCTEAVKRFDFSGAFATTWTEAKFKKNDSGFDVSKILNTGPDYKVSMCAQETDCCSTETENNWITETQTTGSGSCYIPTYGAHLTIKMSGTV